MSGVASAGGTAAASPLRRAAANLSENFQAGGRAATGGEASSGASAGDSGEALRQPAWASRMRRREATRRAASAAEHALKSGDRSIGGSSVDLSQG
jgi:type IV secretion system protein TrbL